MAGRQVRGSAGHWLVLSTLLPLLVGLAAGWLVLRLVGGVWEQRNLVISPGRGTGRGAGLFTVPPGTYTNSSYKVKVDLKRPKSNVFELPSGHCAFSWNQVVRAGLADGQCYRAWPKRTARKALHRNKWERHPMSGEGKINCFELLYEGYVRPVLPAARPRLPGHHRGRGAGRRIGQHAGPDPLPLLL